MAHRILTDRAGTTWQVWAVRPAPRTGPRKAAVAPGYQEGWLTFERVDAVTGPWAATAVVRDTPGRSAEKRRLAPIPATWEEASDTTLLSLLAAAVPVTPARPRARPSSATNVEPPRG